MRFTKLDLSSDGILRLARRAGLPLKKNDVHGAIRYHLSSCHTAGIPFGIDMQDYIIAEEDHWRSATKRHMVFPASETLLQQLMTDAYELTESEGFELPFESFVLALPRGFEVDGVALPTCLVTWVPAQEHISRVYDGFLVRHDQPACTIRVQSENLGQKSLAIIVPARDGSYSRVMCYQRLIPGLLRTESITEYRELVGKLSDNTVAIDLDEYDSKQQYLLLKLVAAIGVYVAACGAQGGFEEGFHNAAQRASVLPKSIKTVQAYTLREVGPVKEDAVAARSMFVQLEADKAPTPAKNGKSRWVFVRNPIASPTDYDRS